jgi:hypothetical protein
MCLSNESRKSCKATNSTTSAKTKEKKNNVLAFYPAKRLQSSWIFLDNSAKNFIKRYTKFN